MTLSRVSLPTVSSSYAVNMFTAYIRDEHFVFTDHHHCFDNTQSSSFTDSQEAHHPTVDVGGEYSTARNDAQRGNK